MRIKTAILISVLFLVAASMAANAQTLVTTIPLGPDEIGRVNTAQGITTRISFPEPVEEVICGDLYDPASGKGSFVVQRSGNDIFLKPIPAKGMSNLFVKTGEKGKRIYNLDLMIVPIAQSHRVVNVLDRQPGDTTNAGEAGSKPPNSDESNKEPSQNAEHTTGNTGKADAELEQRKAEIEQNAQKEADRLISGARQQADDIIADARRRADETLRGARQQSDRITAEAEQKLTDANRLLTQRSEEEAERRLVQALMLGLREARINNPRTVAKKIIVTLEPRILTFDQKSYVRYSIQNAGDKDFSFSAISLETGAGGDKKAIPVAVIQSKTENKLGPGESLAGVIVFDPKIVDAKDKLTLYVRGDDNTEIAHVSIQ